MKQLLLSFSIFALLSSCDNNPQNPKEPNDAAAQQNKVNELITDSSNWTTVQWMDSVQQFGKVTDGEKVLISFHFKNTGNNPLVIANASASCGCTVPSKPEAPIPPGGEGVIKAEFDSQGRVGKADKYITITCNTPQREHILKFEGEVLAKK
jgi:hypothetical protein